MPGDEASIKTVLPVRRDRAWQTGTMLGFSLSPGGLLLPYHLGVLASLSYHGYLTPDTHLAGSSAGAIAVASQACGVLPAVALEGSIRISSRCNPAFLAKGGLMRSLVHELDTLLPKQAVDMVNGRPGLVGMAHFEIFPQFKPVLATQQFETRKCLIDAVCDSSMFPYFTSNKPVRLVKRHGKETPRVVVDGVFTEPLWRFGCPDIQQHLFKDKSASLKRSVSISVFPKELVGLGGIANCLAKNVISPPLQANVVGQVTQLALLACTPGRRQDLTRLYENGWADGEEWVHQEDKTRAQEHARRLITQQQKVPWALMDHSL